MLKIAYFCGVLGISVLILGLCGCSLAPKYKQPSLPIAANYPYDVQTKSFTITNNLTAAETDWRDYFADPYLQQLIIQALANNRNLRTAVLQVKEAQAAYRIERSNQFPAINAGIDGRHMRTPADLSTTGLAQISSQYQVGLTVPAWELDFWGRVRNLKEAALENYLATDEARRAVTVSLIAQVAENYLVLRELDERIMLAKKTIANHQESLRIFTKRFKVGAISQLELSQVETLLTQAQTLGAQLEQARSATIHNLTFLVGSSLPPLPAKNARFDDKIIFHELRVGLPAELLTARPDIVAAEHQLKAAGANIGAARAAFLPQVKLTGSLGWASTELGGLFRSGSGAWDFLPSISVPIFDAGRNRASLDLAKIRSDMAVANYEKTIQTAFREVSDALSARHWLSQQVHIQQRMLTAESERSRLAKLNYDHGASPYLEVLDAERDLLSAQQQLVQARRALLSSRVQLYTALGGGSQHFITAPQPSNKKSFQTKK